MVGLGHPIIDLVGDNLHRRRNKYIVDAEQSILRVVGISKALGTLREGVVEIAREDVVGVG